MSGRNRFWRVAALVAIITGAGAIAMAVGVRIYQYRFEGQDRDGAYHFSLEKETIDAKDGNTVSYTRSVTMRVGPNDVMDVDQEIKDLEEIDLLRQQEARELVRVIETQVNGNMHRTFSFKYVLADGREKIMGEGDPDEQEPIRSPEQIEKDHKEIALLREKGERELVRVMDTWVGNELFRVCTYKYVLADGRDQTVGESDPEHTVAVVSPEQIHDIWRLRRLKEGIYLGYEDKEVQGRLLTFETYILTLSDGTVVTHAVGAPKGLEKILLTEADHEEFRSLLVAEAGEDLGTEVKEVRGRMFSFKRQLYILSDGTEYIWSVGEPIDDQ